MRSYEERAEPVVKANGSAGPWLPSNVRKNMNRTILILVMGFGLFACRKESRPAPNMQSPMSPAPQSFVAYAGELHLAALREVGLEIPPEKLKEHATKLFLFLEPEPHPPAQFFATLAPQEPGYSDENEITFSVGYDYGATTLGYRFVFRRNTGSLDRVVVVPSE
jgi:hypothetical protein